MAAHSQLVDPDFAGNREETSVKYQVLAKETAMVGVVKQKKKSTDEMEEVTLEFAHWTRPVYVRRPCRPMLKGPGGMPFKRASALGMARERGAVMKTSAVKMKSRKKSMKSDIQTTSRMAKSSLSLHSALEDECDDLSIDALEASKSIAKPIEAP